MVRSAAAAFCLNLCPAMILSFLVAVNRALFFVTAPPRVVLQRLSVLDPSRFSIRPNCRAWQPAGNVTLVELRRREHVVQSDSPRNRLLKWISPEACVVNACNAL